MMSDSLSDDEIQQLKQTFAQLDANGDGKITLAELKQAVAKGGSNLVSSATDIEKLLKLADVDGDGVLSYEEVRKRSARSSEFASAQDQLASSVARCSDHSDGATRNSMRCKITTKLAHSRPCVSFSPYPSFC